MDETIPIVLEQCRNCKRLRLNADPKRKIQPVCDWCHAVGSFMPIGTVNLPEVVPVPKVVPVPEDNGERPAEAGGE